MRDTQTLTYKNRPYLHSELCTTRYSFHVYTTNFQLEKIPSLSEFSRKTRKTFPPAGSAILKRIHIRKIDSARNVFIM